MKLIEKAAIAAMQGILANSNTNVNAIDIAEKAMLHANSLLTIMNIPNMNGEDLTNYIMQVDETHADNEVH